MRKFLNKDKSKKPSGDRRINYPEITSRPNIYSYNSNRLKPTDHSVGRDFKISDQIKVQRIPVIWIRVAFLVLIIAAGFSLFNIVSISSNPRIVLLNPNQPGFIRSTKVYQEAAHKLMSESFVDNNKITINTNDIILSLEKQFPEISTVSFKIPLVGRQPTIYIGRSTALIALSTPTSIYLVDNNGRLIGKTNKSRLEVLHLPEIQYGGNVSLSPGQTILSGNEVAFIQTVLYQMQAQKIIISKLTLPAGGDELDMYIAGQNYFVKFNLENNTALQQVGTFLAVRASLSKQGITPSEYIDVMIDGRAYYK